MKTKKLFISIFVMAVVAFTLVTVVSCKKDNQNNNETTTATGIDPMNEYLASFKKKLLSAQKGEEFISLEQARRDMGNLLNYDLGDANYATNVFHRDTLHASLVVTNGQVDLAQLAVTYNASRELIEKTYEQLDLPEKSVYTIHCTFGQQTVNGEAIDVQYVLTTRGLELEARESCYVPLNKTSIDMTDCWSVWDGLGRCDGSDTGYDHVRILELVYNNNMPSMTCISGHLYFTDEGTGSFEAYSYPEPGTSYYRFWTGNGIQLFSDYVFPETMSYYYENMRDVISDRMTLLNDDDYWISAVYCTIIPWVGNYGMYTFSCKYDYGKPHCTGEGFDD